MLKLLEKLNSIHIDEQKCIQSLYYEWKKTKPLKDIKILINIHFTQATLMLPLVFLAAGADLQMTCSSELACHEEIKKIITNLGIYRSEENILSEPQKHHYDVVIDCGAIFAHILKPKIGFVELTHVDKMKYGEHNKVISVDNSFIKFIETSYGTGDGFVRAIQSHYLELKQNYLDKHYMIFGYGKVGAGICLCLKHSGVKQEHITIIEINDALIQKAKQQGFQALSLNNQKKEIHQLLSHAIDCAVTATGVKNSISNFFTAKDFTNTECLINMGTYDEWGQHFHETSILNNKRPLNFILTFPTKILYLDPIFALLAYATLDLINDSSMLSSVMLNAPKLETQKKIFDIWIKDNSLRTYLESLWSEKKEIA